MPLLKGTFRPATKVARSRTNSASEGEKSRSNSISDLEFSRGTKTISNTLVTSQFSAFKVPASPIVVGLSSPHKTPLSSGLFHASPRKTPTTPFSPPPRALLSPHYIEPPTFGIDSEIEDEEDEEEGFVERNIPEQDPFTEPHISTIIESPEKHLSDTFTVAELKPKLSQKPDPFENQWDAKFDCIHSQQEDQLPAPAQTETVETAVETSETQDSVSDGYFSDVMSVTSQESERSDRLGKATVEIVIDKSKMSMSDVIKMKPTKHTYGNHNPLTEIWRDLKRKKDRDAEIDIEKEQSRKDRIQQLIEEAEAMGQTLDEKDIDETELPPIEVEVNPETGDIIVNERSLEVNLKTETDIRETVEEDDAEVTFGKYEDHNVNINSFSRRKPRKNTTWTPLENERFYLALRKVGTDFDLMHKIMPEYTRDQLKRKFKREEKLRLSKIDLALSYSMRIDDNVIEKRPEPPKICSRKNKKAKKEKVEPELSSKKIREDEANYIIESDGEPDDGERPFCKVIVEPDFAPGPPKKPERNWGTVRAKTAREMLREAEDEVYVPRKRLPGKRKSRPLVIKDDDECCHVAMRDSSIDRKVIL